MRNVKFALFAMALVALSLGSCKKDDPEVPNEEEVITDVSYTLTPEGGGETVVLTFQDADGDGGKDPVIVGGTFAANKTYSGAIKLTNKQETPAEDVTEEIEEEAKEHQFFFSSTVAGLSVSYDDKDGDGNPIGLKSKLTTSGAGSGKLTVILRHEPNKSATDVAKGDIKNAGGETDIEVVFPVSVR